ncbi:MAG: hypothetical protein V4736_00045 [Bdellovibrionota bacterium]
MLKNGLNILNNSAEFLKFAGDFLYQAEAENSLLIGFAEGSIKHSPPPAATYLCWVKDDNVVSATARFGVGPNYLLLTSSPQLALVDYVNYLAELKIKLSGVAGPSATSQFFAEKWKLVTSSDMRLGMTQKLYQLDTLIPPRPVAGTIIQADESHISILTSWFISFIKETIPHELPSKAEAKVRVEKFISDGRVFVWKVNDSAVAMAFGNRPTKNGITVSYVYTPPENRKNGFASAVTAGTTDYYLKSGKKFVILYTDAVNPTSNQIYQGIGYYHISDSKLFYFE